MKHSVQVSFLSPRSLLPSTSGYLPVVFLVPRLAAECFMSPFVLRFRVSQSEALIRRKDAFTGELLLQEAVWPKHAALAKKSSKKKKNEKPFKFTGISSKEASAAFRLEMQVKERQKVREGNRLLVG